VEAVAVFREVRVPELLGVTVWLARVSEVDQVSGWLSDAERARAARYQRAADRDRSELSSGLLRYAAFRLTGTAPADVPLARHCPTCGQVGDHGRPVLLDDADAPGAGGPWLSSTHAGEWVAVAACLGAPVGIDLEPAATEVEDGFDDVALTEAERALVAAVRREAGQAAANRQRLMIWTAKEALLKALGRGLAIDPAGVAAPEDAAPIPGLPGDHIGAIVLLPARP
jgi:4'-phosphopantetheinyl transferase